MAKAKAGKEISVTVVNEIGVLADMSKILSDAKINIEGIEGYAKNGSREAEIRLITNNNAKAIKVLKKNNYTAVKEKDILLLGLENKPGALKAITAKIATEGIDIKYLYGTACSRHCPAKIVLCTTNNKKALALLK